MKNYAILLLMLIGLFASCDEPTLPELIAEPTQEPQSTTVDTTTIVVNVMHDGEDATLIRVGAPFDFTSEEVAYSERTCGAAFAPYSLPVPLANGDALSLTLDGITLSASNLQGDANEYARGFLIDAIKSANDITAFELVYIQDEGGIRVISSRAFMERGYEFSILELALTSEDGTACFRFFK